MNECDRKEALSKIKLIINNEKTTFDDLLTKGQQSLSDKPHIKLNVCESSVPISSMPQTVSQEKTIINKNKYESNIEPSNAKVYKTNLIRALLRKAQHNQYKNSYVSSILEVNLCQEQGISIR